MNRQEADAFESAFFRRGLFQQVEPEMDAEDIQDIMTYYETLNLPAAIDKLTKRIISGLEERKQGGMLQ